MSSASASDVAVSLPTPRTRLIGRTAEVATARAQLLDAAVPLLTLVGPGGVGKTRLSLAIGHDIANAFRDGAVFVDLASIRDPGLVPAAIAQAIDVREATDASLTTVLAAALRRKQLLIILDNFEHILDAAPAIADLIDACPAVQVLVTSRAPLRLRGEQLLPISPLETPDEATPLRVDTLEDIEAVALFIERARSVDPRFALCDANATELAEIVRRLDGLPLAIELAAARLRTLSPKALLALFGDRLRLLTGGPRDVSARQRTLRDTIEWSYALLTPEEQSLFRRVTVFAGGLSWTRWRLSWAPIGLTSLMA